jgi:PST family polysaccharide transporter
MQILVLMLLARLLAPDDFGLIAAALVVIRLMTSLSEFGIGAAIIQKETLTPQLVSTAFTFLVIGGGIASSMVWFAAPALAGFFRMADLEPVLKVLAPIILISNVGEIASNLLRRRLAFRRVAENVVISYALGYGVVGVGLAAAGFGSWALVGAFAVQMIIRTGLFLFIEPHAKSLWINQIALMQLLRFGFGLVFFRLANVASLQMDNLVVGRWLGVEALGLYDRAYQFSVMPASFLAQGVLMVIFPVMSQIQREKARMAESFRRGVALAILVTLPISGVIAILAPEIVAILLGSQWQAAAWPLAILSLGLALRIGSRVTTSVATAMAAVYTMAWRQTLYAISVLIGALVGAHWGLGGVAAGMLLAQLVHYLLMIHLAHTLTAVAPKRILLAHGPGLITTALLAPMVWLLRSMLIEQGVAPLAIVCIGFLSCAVILLLIVHTRPASVFGLDGVWLMDALVARVPARRRGLIGWLLGRKPQETSR